jgi:hypothetical protein
VIVQQKDFGFASQDLEAREKEVQHSEIDCLCGR